VGKGVGGEASGDVGWEGAWGKGCGVHPFIPTLLFFFPFVYSHTVSLSLSLSRLGTEIIMTS
jgi:hypothetical protein